MISVNNVMFSSPKFKKANMTTSLNYNALAEFSCESTNTIKTALIVWTYTGDEDIEHLERLVSELNLRRVGRLLLRITHMPMPMLADEVDKFAYNAFYRLCDRINALNFRAIEVFDPSSLRMIYALNNVHVVSPNYMKDEITRNNSMSIDYIVCLSDEQALKYAEYGFDKAVGAKKVLICNKDIKSEKLKIVNCPKTLKGKNVLIVTDYLYKGTTIKHLRDILLNDKGCTNVDIYASHVSSVFEKAFESYTNSSNTNTQFFIGGVYEEFTTNMRNVHVEFPWRC